MDHKTITQRFHFSMDGVYRVHTGVGVLAEVLEPVGYNATAPAHVYCLHLPDGCCK
jgi:hypothetical protein